MFELFVMGGPLFMGIITLIFVAALAVAISAALAVFGSNSNPEPIRKQLDLIKSLGLLALVFGVLGQFIGLFSAFQAIEQMGGSLSPSILAGGLKVSSITTIWGLIAYAVSLIIAVGLSRLSRK